MAEFWVLIIELFQVLREKQLVKIKWFLESKKLQEEGLPFSSSQYFL